MKEAIPTGRRLAAETPNIKEQLVKLQVLRNLFLMAYTGLIQSKLIQPIEQIPEAEKNRLWGQAKGAGLDKEAKIDLCRCLHALEYFENEKL